MLRAPGVAGFNNKAGSTECCRPTHADGGSDAFVDASAATVVVTIDSVPAAIETSVDTIAPAIQPLVNAITLTIEAIVYPVTLAIEAFGTLIMTRVGRTL